MPLLDNTFYTKLINYAKQLNARPEDLLVVMASESGLNPASTKGMPYRGLTTLGWQPGFTDQFMTKDEWDRLADMPPSEAIDYSYKQFAQYMKMYGRKRWVNALDMYLANAAPDVWRRNNNTLDSVVYPYGSANWKANKGIIGGQERDILVKDLVSFLNRPGSKAIWSSAIRELNNFRLQAGLPSQGGYTPVSFIEYVPDFDIQDINAENTQSGIYVDKPVQSLGTFEHVALFGGLLLLGYAIFSHKGK